MFSRIPPQLSTSPNVQVLQDPVLRTSCLAIVSGIRPLQNETSPCNSQRAGFRFFCSREKWTFWTIHIHCSNVYGNTNFYYLAVASTLNTTHLSYAPASPNISSIFASNHYCFQNSMMLPRLKGSLSAQYAYLQVLKDFDGTRKSRPYFSNNVL
jgi:hypothetical protein